MIVIRRSQLLLTNKKDILLSLADKSYPRLSLKYQEVAVVEGTKQQQKRNNKKPKNKPRSGFCDISTTRAIQKVGDTLLESSLNVDDDRAIGQHRTSTRR